MSCLVFVLAYFELALAKKMVHVMYSTSCCGIDSTGEGYLFVSKIESDNFRVARKRAYGSV